MKPINRKPNRSPYTFFLEKFLTQRSLLRGLGVVVSLGMLGGGVVWAQEASVPTDIEPVSVESEPVSVEIAPVDSIDHGVSEPEYQTLPPTEETVTESVTEPEPTWNNVPTEVAPPPEEIPYPEPSYGESPRESENSYNTPIDSTEYNVGATDSYEAPTSVQFSDRSTGCNATLGIGEGVGDSLCGSLPPVETTAGGKSWEEISPPLYQSENYAGNHGNGSGMEGGRYSNPPWFPPVTEGQTDQGYFVPASYGSGLQVGNGMGSVGSIPVEAMGMMGTSSTGLGYYNLSARPPRVRGNGNKGLLFPLSIPAPITSLFGWRVHPVLGYGRFHSGVDLGAPLGTPVVAAYAGQVTIADWLGGYGVSVVLDHQKQTKETLYAHLSELFVKPGEWVQQGDVIGRVGSTGMSTGPHLHFELRRQTKDGWVAVDPGQQLEYALAQMTQVLQTAQKPSTFPLKIPVLPIVPDAETDTVMMLPIPAGIEIEIYELEPPPIDLTMVVESKKAKAK